MLERIESRPTTNQYPALKASSSSLKLTLKPVKLVEKKGNKTAEVIADICARLIDAALEFKRKSSVPTMKAPFRSYELAKINQLLKSFPERPWMKDKCYSQKTISILQEIFQEIHELTKDRPDISKVREMMVAEVISKRYAGMDPDPGQKIALPAVDVTGECRMVEYVVTHKVQLEGTRIPVVTLKPQEAGFAPIVLFRSTSPYPKNEGGFRSIPENIDPRGVARTVYEKSLPKFSKMMQELDHPKVIGYSQGGALAQRFIVDFSHLLNQRESSFVYNAPAIEKDYKARWDALSQERRAPVENILVSYDFVSKVGAHFIGNLTEIEPAERGSYLSPHFDLKLFDEGWKAYAVDEKAESQTLERKLCKMIQTSEKTDQLYHAIVDNFGLVDQISDVLAPVA